MKKILVAATAVLMMSSLASAGTIPFTNGSLTVNLVYTPTDNGGGITSYKVEVDDPLNQSQSWFLGALTFTGKIGQNKAFGILDVNDEVNAAAFAVTPGSGYTKATDSFFFTPFTANTLAPGVTDSNAATTGFAQRAYAITAGSGGGSGLDVATVAQIVASTDVVVTGTISRNGLVYQGGGTMSAVVVPEPSSFVLLGMGVAGLGFLARRRKAA